MTRLVENVAWKAVAFRYILILFVIVASSAVVACGGDDDDDDDDGGDENVAVEQLGSTAEAATYAYAEVGASGLYDYVAQTVKDVCTVEDFEADLAGTEEPTSFRGMEDAEIDGETATATVVLIFDTEDREQEWSFVDEGENTWRITAVPDMDQCSPS